MSAAESRDSETGMGVEVPRSERDRVFFGYLAAKHKAIRDPILWPTIDASEMLSSTIADSSHVAKLSMSSHILPSDRP